MDRLRDTKEVWLNVFLQGKLMVMKSKRVPSGYDPGKSYADLGALKERTLCYLIPKFQELPDSVKRDTFDFFTMALFDRNILKKIRE